MSCRHLNITFKENGDVEYSFFKHHAEFKLYKYQIDYPIEMIEIVGGQDYDIENFKFIEMTNGFALLSWDKLKEDEYGARGVTYIKKKFLKKFEHSDGTFTFKFYENISIKAPKQGDTFSLWLHTPYSNISAVKKLSSATYNGTKYQPRELSEIVFNKSGILAVDWELEILKKK